MRKILYLEPDEDWFLTVRRGTRKLLPGEWLIERAAALDSFESLLNMDRYEMAMVSWPDFTADEPQDRARYMGFIQHLLELNDGRMHVILLPESSSLHLDTAVAEMVSTGRIHVVPKKGFSEQALLEKIFEITKMLPNTLLVGGSEEHFQQIARLLNLRCDNLQCVHQASLDGFIDACRQQDYSGYVLEFELLGTEGSKKLIALLLKQIVSPLLLVAYEDNVLLNRTLLGLIGHRHIDFLSARHLDAQALYKLVHSIQVPKLD